MATFDQHHQVVTTQYNAEHITIYTQATPRPVDAASRNRRAMIEKVWATWITGFLQPSLPQDILLDLGLTERPAMIARIPANVPGTPNLTMPGGARWRGVGDRVGASSVEKAV
jgi:hypothetical protein